MKMLAGDVLDPQSEYLSDYQQGDTVKKIEIDINGDATADFLFTTIQANPDPTDQQAVEQEAGCLFWTVYVKKAGVTSYTLGDKIDNGDGISQGATLGLNPNQMYVGNIPEIGRYGVVTLAVKRSRSENSRVIYAYTWETDHFKQWKLAEYLESEQNALFDKYLKEDKRTHVVLQQIKP